ncbi:hypothetical protein FNAPI_7108 [Fusarium napiforme]|uniref:Uncharacterized protein n=1 Tax=Fusarium napiforme TaxID=42672 RepID=A0A8H5N3M8_9HYPO|nr:hypothetical protein FNAPI_7108 [Fusarium napiforme]
MARSMEHHATGSMTTRKISAEWLMGYGAHRARAGRVQHTRKAVSWMIKDREILASFAFHGSAHPPTYLRVECHGEMSSVVSLDRDRPSLARVSSNRVDSSRPPSLHIQIVDGTHGYPLDIRLVRAQDYNYNINRDHVLMYNIFLLDTFS